jgi:pyruvate dehydrogenase E2 component (dihydrolipoyllysine-residue acetyltransferase)
MTDVIMPQMGESIAEGTVTKWMKNVGEKVERDEPLFEISTDKVDAEIPSPAAGILKEIRVEAGSTVGINTVVAVIVPESEAVAAPVAPPATPPAPVTQLAPPPPVVAPQPQAAPAPAPPAPPVAPVVSAPPAPPVAPVAPPAPVVAPPAPAETVRVTLPPATTFAPPPAPPPPVSKPRSDMSVEELRQTRSSPVVRKIAAEHHVDIRDVPGTGISGRVTKHDILQHIEVREGHDEEPAATPPVALESPQPATPPPSETRHAPAPPVVPPFQKGERIEVVPMTPIRRKTAEHMVLSKRTSAHVSTVWEIDMTRVDHLRAKHRHAYEERSGVKLTYLPFIVKATVDALKAFPILNASVDGDSIVYRKDIHLGMAVALDWGLIVPVIRNADEKNLLGTAKAVADLAERARSKRLKVEEVQGGTFTITNPGVFGGLFGTPVINQPQVAILAVGTIEKRPVIRDDAIAIRTMAYFALTFDHRIIDGSDADRFMAHVKKGLQEFDEAAVV